jgi:hypothetical protein
MEMTEGSVHYTTGSLDNPTPRTVSLLKRHLLPGGGLAQSQLLKEDIVKTLNFINAARATYNKMTQASIKLASSLSAASEDELRALHHRCQEVGVMHQIQKVKRESLKYNTELQRTFQHGTINNSNIKRKLVRPEHFERGHLPTKNVALRKSAAQPAPLVNRKKGITSPWEGSQFKYEILGSLREKLLKKVVLYGLRCYVQRCRAVRQCAVTCQRSKLKRLVQLCFSSLLFEALSGKYIAFAAWQASQRYLLKRVLRPALHTLRQWIIQSHLRAEQQRHAKALHQRRLRRDGMRLLQWNVRYGQVSRVRQRWATRYSQEHTLLTAFSAWITSFVRKNDLRRQVFARVSRVEERYDAPTTPLHSGLRGSGNVSREPLSPLQVLTQEPLQNMRDAVSFITSRMTPRTPLRYRCDELDGNSEGSPLSSEGNDSCEAQHHSLHVHTMSALKTLRAQLADATQVQDGTNSAPPLKHQRKRVAPERGPVQDSVVSPALRKTFADCVTTRKLLPQRRFSASPTLSGVGRKAAHSADASGYSSGVHRHTINTGRSGSSDSPSEPSSGDLSSDAEHVVHSARRVSEAWLHRHSRRAAETSGYLPGRSEQHGDTSYG